MLFQSEFARQCRTKPITCTRPYSPQGVMRTKREKRKKKRKRNVSNCVPFGWMISLKWPKLKALYQKLVTHKYSTVQYIYKALKIPFANTWDFCITDYQFIHISTVHYVWIWTLFNIRNIIYVRSCSFIKCLSNIMTWFCSYSCVIFSRFRFISPLPIFQRFSDYCVMLSITKRYHQADH